MNITNSIISYWKIGCHIPQSIYSENDFYIIYGKYNHKNSELVGRKSLGICWKNFPTSRTTIAPIALPMNIGISILTGLLHDFMKANDDKNIKKYKKLLSSLSLMKIN